VEDAASKHQSIGEEGTLMQLCSKVECISSFQNTLHFIFYYFTPYFSLFCAQNIFFDSLKKINKYGSRASSYVYHGGDFEKAEFHCC
jgi:hypothetical protein